jgi:heme oxygenase
MRPWLSSVALARYKPMQGASPARRLLMISPECSIAERRLTPSLPERLKTETQALHTAAERSVFIGELLRGRMQRSAYCDLLVNLHAIYATLEPALDRHAAHPCIAPILIPGLRRTASLEHDLQCLRGPGATQPVHLQDATQAYVDRLNELDSSRPELLLAHAYVRYLGDLSGGQILSKVVAKSFDPVGTSGPSCVAFYDFGDTLHTQELTRRFRGGLDAVVLDRAAEDAIVAEAMSAFGLHRQLFDELAQE